MRDKKEIGFSVVDRPVELDMPICSSGHTKSVFRDHLKSAHEDLKGPRRDWYNGLLSLSFAADTLGDEEDLQLLRETLSDLAWGTRGRAKS